MDPLISTKVCHKNVNRYASWYLNLAIRTLIKNTLKQSSGTTQNSQVTTVKASVQFV